MPPNYYEIIFTSRHFIFNEYQFLFYDEFLNTKGPFVYFPLCTISSFNNNVTTLINHTEKHFQIALS